MLEGLPGAAVWFRPGGERFRLPAERLLRRSGLARVRDDTGWALAATSGAAAATAEALTPQVDRLSAAASLVLLLDPGAALTAVDRVADVLDVVPLVPRDEVRRWRDWRTVLTPLAAYRRLSLVSVVAADDGGSAAATRGGAFRLRLEGDGDGPPR